MYSDRSINAPMKIASITISISHFYALNSSAESFSLDFGWFQCVKTVLTTCIILHRLYQNMAGSVYPFLSFSTCLSSISRIMNVIKIPDHSKACISDHCISNKKAVYTKTKEYSISIKTIEID